MVKKFSIYVFLILNFLGISASFSPTEQGIKYLVNEKIFSNFFPQESTSLILSDYFETGFLIKSYYQKYRVIHGFKPPEEVIFRTSESFFEKNKKNLGMSLFRKTESDNKISTIPMPPGTIYIGNRAYGYWRLFNSGARRWQFHRAYRHFSNILGWEKFKPSKKFFAKLKIYLENGSPFYGLNNEFGLNGSITLKTFKKPLLEVKTLNFKFYKAYFKNKFRLPWNKYESNIR